LTSNHTPASGAYDLLKDMVLLNAKNVKIGDIIKVPGVGTTHIVLCELDFKQRRDSVGVYYRNEKDEVVFYERNWVGGCARGFKNLIPHYGDSVLSQSKVGEAETMVTDMRATYDIEKELIGKEPQIFLCENEDCIDCRLSWSFSDMSLLHFVWRNTLSFKLRSVLNALKLYLFGRVIAGYQIVK
ncbi:MAG: hypothetical protein HRT61_18970, partial [Ekhidna sp.]|nr:hypothetical protein [Ekhidna sp.]